jgi:hypothetical protein
MLIGAEWMIAWRLATRIVDFLSNCGWIVPIRSNELAELLRYLNAVLLITTTIWCGRLGAWRKPQVFVARRQAARNHFGDRGIVAGDWRSLVAPVAQGYFGGSRVDHFMNAERHNGTLVARPSLACFATKLPLRSVYRRLTGDPAV